MHRMGGSGRVCARTLREALQELKNQHDPVPLVPLAGSAVSMSSPAGIPTVAQFRAAFREILRRGAIPVPQGMNWKSILGLPFERLLQEMQDVLCQAQWSAQLVEALYAGAQPNANHETLARLLIEGQVPLVLDPLWPRWLQRRGEYRRHCGDFTGGVADFRRVRDRLRQQLRDDPPPRGSIDEADLVQALVSILYAEIEILALTGRGREHRLRRASMCERLARNRHEIAVAHPGVPLPPQYEAHFYEAEISMLREDWKGAIASYGVFINSATYWNAGAVPLANQRIVAARAALGQRREAFLLWRQSFTVARTSNDPVRSLQHVWGLPALLLGQPNLLWATRRSATQLYGVLELVRRLRHRLWRLD